MKSEPSSQLPFNMDMMLRFGFSATMESSSSKKKSSNPLEQLSDFSRYTSVYCSIQAVIDEVSGPAGNRLRH